ncbi:E3 ubiquitin-protein ligase SHPRH [Phlebotomus papatasi]|uniref:E3 ubiquitin-protein ligase SHPRH n=1 Tax=Phlebotomus papatasi TaxID=29031 RepID=UPI0024833C1C|nr:E3 ubiquitin-protein ligase SHPRH [Phlebotomus papatasi]
MSYFLGFLGKQVEDEGVPSENEFVYDRRRYEIKLNFGCNIRTLLSDIKKVPQYSLRVTEDGEGGGTFLGVYFTPFPDYTSNIASRARLFRIFFSVEEEAQGEGDAGKSYEPISFTKLYEKLREAHIREKLEENIENCDENVQHEGLRPELRPYQRDAVEWLLKRELRTETLPTDYEEISARALSDQIFYYNPRTLDIVDSEPDVIDIPTGGILADEMGLGKTVEMLALILNNPRECVKKPDFGDVDEEDEPLANIAKELHNRVQCLCGGRLVKNKKKLIKCMKCFKSQHQTCVVRVAENPPEKYICPDCWKKEPPVESKATFIVSPASIKKQWESEIIRHIRDPNFRVLVYDGVTNSGWIDPGQLAEYDVVVTDYNVMRSEIYFTNENSRSGTLRHEKKHMNPTSPLPCIHWWRVCLDEAQMVESTTAQCARMVKTLPAVHRWAVTGTPIEKHISNLFGLIYFLDVYPFTDSRVWERKLAIPFVQGNFEPLVEVLQKIMWRTCKSLVFEQIGIPPQKEVVHYVTMSDLQTFFYRTQHSLCRSAFMEKARKISTGLAMSRMNAHILKLLLEPLRKLRLDCTVPSIVRGHRQDQTTVKKILGPNELHAHLVANNENEAKAQLRNIASSFNGLAGIAMIRNDREEAERMYKAVLRRAKDYTGTICVDSLLQIHALHNLIEIGNLTRTQEEGQEKEEGSEDVRSEYRAELKRLEGKYISTYHTMVKQVEKQLRNATNTLDALEAEMETTNGNWWREIFAAIRNTNRETVLLDKVFIEINEQFGMNLQEELKTTQGIDLKLTVWLDNVFESRRAVAKAFKKLRFFTENISPTRQSDPEIREKIERLIYDAFDCHLNVEDDKDSAAPKSKKKRSEVCKLCRVKDKLRKFECFIFNKVFLETMNTVRGSWNPSMEEVIARTILSCYKKEHTSREVLAEAEAHLEYIEGIKKEYKEYSQLWSEIDFTVSAFDELKMCKSRLEAIRPEDLEKGQKKSKNQIFTYEIGVIGEEFQQELQMAEKEFMRIWGVLKYLKHLEKNSGPEVCPICTQIPEEKYSVLECGHHLCMVCMVQMRKYHRHYLTCSVCRHKQKYKDVYYVTLRPVQGHQDVIVKGEHSAKILDMVKLILTLVKDEPDVKILVFYHWDTVLPVLENALYDNGVKYICNRSNKFHKIVQDFKDPRLGITCFLLPLAYGSKGLNLVEATHVILLEPILNPGEELQAIGRVHRIGQTRPTFVHRFIVLGTIEETIYKTISNDKTGKWEAKDITVDNLMSLFELPSGEEVLDWDAYI